MTKIAQNLTTQLKDVARAFYLEVWGQALTAAGVSTKSELRAPDKVHYPSALRLAPSPSPPSTDPNSAFASIQPTTTLATTPATKKGQDQPPPVAVVDVELDEVAEVEKLKRKKKEKEIEKEEEKGK